MSEMAESMNIEGCFEAEVSAVLRQARDGSVTTAYPRAWEAFRDNVEAQEFIIEAAGQLAPTSGPAVMQQALAIMLVAGIAIGAAMPRWNE